MNLSFPKCQNINYFSPSPSDQIFVFIDHWQEDRQIGGQKYRGTEEFADNRSVGQVDKKTIGQ